MEDEDDPFQDDYEEKEMKDFLERGESHSCLTNNALKMIFGWNVLASALILCGVVLKRSKQSQFRQTKQRKVR